MTMTSPRPAASATIASSEPGRTWTMAVGAMLVLAGTLAIVFPFFSSITVTIFVGWLLMIAGVLHVVHAFGARGWEGSLLYGLVGVVLLAGGALTVFNPLAGVLTLTALLAAVFVTEGVIEIVAALRLRHRRNWGWLLASGIVGVVAGLVIAAALPVSALWVIGLVAGVNLIFSGMGYLTHAGAEEPGAAAGTT